MHRVPERHLAGLLQEVVTASEADYQRAGTYYAAMMLSFRSVQMNEARSLDLDDVSRLLVDGDATARETILGFQNFNEFVLLFALFEDAVKELLASPGGDTPAVLKEPEVMERLLTHLQGMKSAKRFQAKLVERTICKNYDDAKLMWKYFVRFRHLYVHSGGRPTIKWLGDYEQGRSALVHRLKGPDIAVENVREIIESIQPRERVLLMLPDGIVNIFRNFVVAVMESIYLAWTTGPT